MSKICEFLGEAQAQLQRCAIPTVVAVAASVVIAKLGVPVIALGAVVAGGYAYYIGYRVRVTKPGKDENETDNSQE